VGPEVFQGALSCFVGSAFVIEQVHQQRFCRELPPLTTPALCPSQYAALGGEKHRD
jgi:hypothetical protein